jgi:hypothetical protein
MWPPIYLPRSGGSPNIRSYTVMAGLVPAISSRTGATTDGRDKPGHDGQKEQ